MTYNAVPVKLPGYRHPLYLVAVRGFGQEPMMLLTSQKVDLTANAINPKPNNHTLGTIPILRLRFAPFVNLGRSP